jgi:hypothetical protein
MLTMAPNMQPVYTDFANASGSNSSTLIGIASGGGVLGILMIAVLSYLFVRRRNRRALALSMKNSNAQRYVLSGVDGYATYISGVTDILASQNTAMQTSSPTLDYDDIIFSRSTDMIL